MRRLASLALSIALVLAGILFEYQPITAANINVNAVLDDPTTYGATFAPMQHKTFFASTRYWVFFSDGAWDLSPTDWCTETEPYRGCLSASYQSYNDHVQVIWTSDSSSPYKVGFAALDTAVSSGLVSWWPGEGNGNDIAGGNNATLRNGVGFAAGRVGQSFAFDGENDYIEVAHSPSLDIGTGNTFAAWVKLEAYPPAGQGAPVFAKWRDSYEDKFLAIGADGRVGYYLWGASGTAALYSDTALATGVWHHIAGTYDGAMVRIYFDGQLDASAMAAGDVSDASGTLYFGYNPDRVHTGTSAYFKGQMDELRWYDRALNQVEVEVLANPANRPPADPSAPSGSASGTTSTEYQYSAQTTDPDGDRLVYTFDWGDGSASTTDMLDSGATATMAHTWTQPGTYSVRVRATDSKGDSSPWSSGLTVEIDGAFTAGVPWWIWVIIGLAVASVGGIGLGYYRRRNKTRQKASQPPGENFDDIKRLIDDTDNILRTAMDSAVAANDQLWVSALRFLREELSDLRRRVELGTIVHADAKERSLNLGRRADTLRNPPYRQSAKGEPKSTKAESPSTDDLAYFNLGVSRNADSYEIMGVKSTATKEEVKSAYDHLMHEWHPDYSRTKRGTEIRTAVCKIINNAKTEIYKQRGWK